jgi:hypothetical protein
MSMVDPWEKAADCERAAQAAVEPKRRAIFKILRDQWVDLANKRTLMTEADMATGIESLNRRQVELDVAGRMT